MTEKFSNRSGCPRLLAVSGVIHRGYTTDGGPATKREYTDDISRPDAIDSRARVLCLRDAVTETKNLGKGGVVGFTGLSRAPRPVTELHVF
jgi:hypothetical protein